MVVQGGHLEEPLAVGQLEVTHLDNIGQRLQNVDDAYGDQHQGHIEHKGQGCHCAAQKQAAGVPHEHLGRVVVIDEEGCQPSRHSRREQSLDAVGAPEDAGYGEERHHHKGDAGSQPVDAVGQIHSVDAAHNDEGREDQIHDPVDGKAHVQEGDIQVVGQQALVPHQHQEHHRRRQLKDELLPGRQSLVLVLADLAVVVHKADQAEDQGEEIHVEVPEHPLQHEAPTQDEHGDARTQDEHDAAHGGRAGLGLVPRGSVLPDLLAGLQLAQLRDEKSADEQRQHKADGRRDQRKCHISVSLSFAGHSPGPLVRS